MSSAIVFIHGLWMNGMEMKVLDSRFSKSGYDTTQFKYGSTDQTPIENARLLSDHIDSINADTIHFVCHSLGGLVLRHYLNFSNAGNSGRIVMLGTPNKTSIAAREFSRWPLAPSMLGKSVNEGLFGPLPDWTSKQELGVIAGDLRFGLGMFIPNIPKPNDGTVAVEETHLGGIQDHITLHVSHFGMLISIEVFKQAKHFIEQGHFMHA